MSAGNLNEIGQQFSSESAPVVLSTEQEQMLLELSLSSQDASSPNSNNYGIAILGNDGTNNRQIKTDEEGRVNIYQDDLVNVLETILRQLRNRPEITPYGNVKVELQSTSSGVTVSGNLTNLLNVGAAATDQSFNTFMAQNLLFRTQLNQILL